MVWSAERLLDGKGYIVRGVRTSSRPSNRSGNFGADSIHPCSCRPSAPVCTWARTNEAMALSLTETERLAATASAAASRAWASAAIVVRGTSQGREPKEKVVCVMCCVRACKRACGRGVDWLTALMEEVCSAFWLSLT